MRRRPAYPSLNKLAVAAIVLPAAACAAVPFEYAAIPIAPVRLRCHDAYMAYNNRDAKKVVIVPYLVSEAAQSVCQDKPLADRAREAAEKHLGATCRITGTSTPLPLNYEYSYVCDVPAAAAKPAAAPKPATTPKPAK